MKTLRCYVPGCQNTHRVPWLVYLWAIGYTRSLKPFVCPEHYSLFDALPTKE